MDEQKTMGAYALRSAALGWPIFPCHTVRDGRCSCGKADCGNPGKHPRTENGLKAATTDTGQIQNWWNEWPDANIAYAPDANTVILDVDIGHGTDKRGDKTIAELEAEKGKLPVTLTSLTGGGGRHCIYTTSRSIKNGTDVLPGIDIRTSGGYIILPPSNHVSGNPYTWDPAADDTDNIAPLPEWLYATLTKKKPKKQATPGKSEKIGEGERNDTLFKNASRLRAAELDEDAIFAALLVINKTQCAPPLSEDEVRTIAQSAAKYDKGATKNPIQAETLIKLVEDIGADFFHSDVNEPYAFIPVDKRNEIWPIDSRSFKTWLHRLYYNHTKKPINSDTVAQVAAVLIAKAQYDAPEPVILSTRVAAHGGAYWYDLANPAWQAVRITPDGWSVTDKPPIIFNRYPHQAAQVMPQPGGDVRKLLQYVTLKEQQTLFLCWLIACFIPGIPHAMPIFYGEKGAAKSTTCALLKKVVDPS